MTANSAPVVLAVAVNRPTEHPTGDAPVDRELIAGLRAGDEAAFEALVRLYGGRMLAVARRLLRDEEDARDAVQDAFISAFRSVASFRGECRLSTWLHRVVVNAALMRLRTERRRHEASIDDLLPSFRADGRHAAAVDPWPDVERALDHEETRATVRAAIARLPEAYRTVVVLRDIEDLDTATVARLLDSTPNAVKIRLHRARQALATSLTPVFRVADRGGLTRAESLCPAS
jgi:RNA polymerase sigma-70 factor (ECF subfamily)